MSSVLVTGTSTGIGRATAARLDRAGWDVWAAIRDPSDGERLSRAASDRLRPVLLDVTDAASIELVREQLERAGGLDALVNNAGIGIAGPLELLTPEELRDQLEVNVIGQLAVTQSMLPLLRAARGRVVFVSSVGGKVAFPFAGAYHASKFAIEAIGDSLRVELEPDGIEVVLVEPPAISTPIWAKAERWIEQIRTRPGAERYAERLEKFEQRLRSADQSGSDPDEVAAVIATALGDSNPSSRYPVGLSAKLLGPLRAALGDGPFDRLAGRLTS